MMDGTLDTSQAMSSLMPASAAYRWTLNHTMQLDDPLELFPTFVVEAGL